jgi:hypothetical protein
MHQERHSLRRIPIRHLRGGGGGMAHLQNIYSHEWTLLLLRINQTFSPIAFFWLFFFWRDDENVMHIFHPNPPLTLNTIRSCPGVPYILCARTLYLYLIKKERRCTHTLPRKNCLRILKCHLLHLLAPNCPFYWRLPPPCCTTICLRLAVTFWCVLMFSTLDDHRVPRDVHKTKN